MPCLLLSDLHFHTQCTLTHWSSIFFVPLLGIWNVWSLQTLTKKVCIHTSWRLPCCGHVNNMLPMTQFGVISKRACKCSSQSSWKLFKGAPWIIISLKKSTCWRKLAQMWNKNASRSSNISRKIFSWLPHLILMKNWSLWVGCILP